MVSTTTKPAALESFLCLPETKPAYEFLDGQITQKPMPQGKHSLLQGSLCPAINQVAQPTKIAIAFPELRCTFGEASIVPDISVFRWERIPRDQSGEVANRFEICPDWAIEILSPEQRQIKVLENLLHCIDHGTELGWLIDSQDENILGISSNRRIQIFKGADTLPVLNGVNLALTAKQIFGWLKF
ncbi:MAG: Uma2 family endonuclease [Pseudanabaenaceae cyanobacterium bins.39]|nr:Uma2 family endonuclease [Pseudanabaenaceae cyanobacterium bins.39]